MFANFFKQDNATIKLSSWLVLIVSILTLAVDYFHLSDMPLLIVTVVSGVAGIGAQFFQNNKVISNSTWIVFAYTLLAYLSGSEQFSQLWPQGQAVVGFAGAVLKLFAPASKQEPGDAKPPKADGV